MGALSSASGRTPVRVFPRLVPVYKATLPDDWFLSQTSSSSDLPPSPSPTTLLLSYEYASTHTPGLSALYEVLAGLRSSRSFVPTPHHPHLVCTPSDSSHHGRETLLNSSWRGYGGACVHQPSFCLGGCKQAGRSGRSGLLTTGFYPPVVGETARLWWGSGDLVAVLERNFLVIIYLLVRSRDRSLSPADCSLPL